MATPDLVPSVTSRVVTIDVVTLGEDAPAAGEVTFELPTDLHVAKDQRIIQDGRITVTLVDGRGEVRLPTYDPDAEPDGWAILVHKSWAPQPYPIRVPVGTAPISLAELQPVTGGYTTTRVWGLSGAGLTIVPVGSDEGASGSVALGGGIANFTLRIPQGAPGLGGALERLADGNMRYVESSAGATVDTIAQAMGFYLLQGPSTGATTRKGLPVYWIDPA